MKTYHKGFVCDSGYRPPVPPRLSSANKTPPSYNSLPQVVPTSQVHNASPTPRSNRSYEESMFGDAVAPDQVLTPTHTLNCITNNSVCNKIVLALQGSCNEGDLRFKLLTANKDVVWLTPLPSEEIRAHLRINASKVYSFTNLTKRPIGDKCTPDGSDMSNVRYYFEITAQTGFIQHRDYDDSMFAAANAMPFTFTLPKWVQKDKLSTSESILSTMGTAIRSTFDKLVLYVRATAHPKGSSVTYVNCLTADERHIAIHLKGALGDMFQTQLTNKKVYTFTRLNGKRSPTNRENSMSVILNVSEQTNIELVEFGDPTTPNSEPKSTPDSNPKSTPDSNPKSTPNSIPPTMALSEVVNYENEKARVVAHLWRQPELKPNGVMMYIADAKGDKLQVQFASKGASLTFVPLEHDFLFEGTITRADSVYMMMCSSAVNLMNV